MACVGWTTGWRRLLPRPHFPRDMAPFSAIESPTQEAYADLLYASVQLFVGMSPAQSRRQPVVDQRLGRRIYLAIPEIMVGNPPVRRKLAGSLPIQTYPTTRGIERCAFSSLARG